MFLTVAAMIAYRRSLNILVGGMCETDFSGYPDCRDDAIKALQVALNIGMDTRINLVTPLMWKNKKETWQLAYDLGGQTLVELIVKDTLPVMSANTTGTCMGIRMRKMSGLPVEKTWI